MRDNWKASYAFGENIPDRDVSKIVISDGDVIAEHIEDEGYHVSRAIFSSVDEYIEQVERMLNIESTEWYGSKYFTFGSRDYQESKEILEEGRTPSDKVTECYERLKSIVDGKIGMQVPVERCRSARRKRRQAWAGGNINVTKFVEDQQTGRVSPCFIAMSKRADRPVVRIGLNICMSHQNTEDDFGRLAATAAVLCERLEILGYGVEIHAYSGGRFTSMNCKNQPNGHPLKEGWGRSWWRANTWLLKSGNDPLDVQRIMSNGISALLRLWGFSEEFLVHGGACPSSTKAEDTPDEVVKLAGLDVLVEKTWSRTSGDEENADRIVGIIQELIGTPTT
jgi:hypothetical protein